MIKWIQLLPFQYKSVKMSYSVFFFFLIVLRSEVTEMGWQLKDNIFQILAFFEVWRLLVVNICTFQV